MNTRIASVWIIRYFSHGTSKAISVLASIPNIGDGFRLRHLRLVTYQNLTKFQSKSFKIVEILDLSFILFQIWRTRKSFLNPLLNISIILFYQIIKFFLFNESIDVDTDDDDEDDDDDDEKEDEKDEGTIVPNTPKNSQKQNNKLNGQTSKCDTIQHFLPLKLS